MEVKNESGEILGIKKAGLFELTHYSVVTLSEFLKKDRATWT